MLGVTTKSAEISGWREIIMNPKERELVEELKRSMNKPLPKKVVESYLAAGTTESILKPLLEALNKELERDETA